MPPPAVSGVLQPAQEPGDDARAALAALLYLPRKTVELLFLASGTAAGLIHNEQVVPRIAELVSPDEGEIGVFPTMFAETGRGFNVGARMIANLGSVATSLRAGYGGPDEIVTEARIRISRPAPLPATLSLEWFQDRRTDLDYLGVGQVPVEDPRNRFLPAATTREALYRERRERAIVSLGIRPLDDLELFLSGSLTRLRVDDPEDADAAALSRVFDVATLPGTFSTATHTYLEIAFRLDTRATRGRPSPGALAELYGGVGVGLTARPDGPPGERLPRFARAGGRIAGFIPLLYPSNIVSPRIVLDGIAPLSGDAVPFSELARQPDFRGIDTRRDRISLVSSLDYRWTVVRYVAARLFVDAATVAPALDQVRFRHTRLAVGFGADVSSSSAEVARFAMAFSAEGARFLVSLGVPSIFGDRQHRD